jgi:type II secretory pathway predicted ATPase ExeA
MPMAPALLVGQPTVRRMIKLGVLAALGQRTTVRFQMNGMTDTETADYIRHHLKAAGRKDPLFPDDAIALIHDSSRGKPSQINDLASAALVATYTAGKKIVDEPAARAAVAEVIATE